MTAILDIKENKLDYDSLKKQLISEKNKFIGIADKYDLFCVDYKFPEKKESDKYSLQFRLTKIIGKESYVYFYIGQSGCFFEQNIKKNDMNDLFEFFIPFITELKNLCEKFVFKPYGVAHVSDGDYYLKDKSDFDKFQHFVGKENVAKL